MTPDDLASAFDELEAELYALREDYARMCRWHEMEHDRAARAEAALARADEMTAGLADQVAGLQAALARVRALCDAADVRNPSDSYWPAKVRAAVEGDSQ